MLAEEETEVMFILTGTVNYKDNREADLPQQRCALEWSVGEAIAEIIKRENAKGASSFMFVVSNAKQ